MNLNQSASTDFVFDLGGVLIDWNPRHLYRKLFADESDMEAFLGRVCTPEWNSRQDEGRSLNEATEELVHRFPEQEALIRAYYQRWEEMIGGEISGTVKILKRLRERSRTLYALSNWSAETFPRVRSRFQFLQWFDDILLSGAAGVRKPDAEIFQQFLTRIDRRAPDCLFIDDSLENVEAACRLGFQTIHFASPEQLEGELVGRKLL